MKNAARPHDILLLWPNAIAPNAVEHADWKNFLQRMTNRRCVGGLRYGKPKPSQKYLSRLKAELKTYTKTGNAEHLINIAVYTWLEQFAPEHKKFHFDNTVESATRKKEKSVTRSN